MRNIYVSRAILLDAESLLELLQTWSTGLHTSAQGIFATGQKRLPELACAVGHHVRASAVWARAAVSTAVHDAYDRFGIAPSVATDVNEPRLEQQFIVQEVLSEADEWTRATQPVVIAQRAIDQVVEMQTVAARQVDAAAYELDLALEALRPHMDIGRADGSVVHRLPLASPVGVREQLAKPDMARIPFRRTARAA